MSSSTKPQLATITGLSNNASSLVVDNKTAVSSDISSNESSSPKPSSPSDTSSNTVNPRKRKQTLEDVDQKQKERILRNRAAAQDSRDRKRRYISTLETTNEQLKEQNNELTEKLKTVETENQLLSAQLRMFVSQLSQAQDQLRFNDITQFLLGGFRDSARVALRIPQLSATSETAKSEPSEYSQDFLCIEPTTKDVNVLPSPSFSPTLSLSSDDTLIDTLSPPQSNELMIPLQEKLPSGLVDIRLDDLLDWSGEQTLQLDSKQMEF
ncbi:hypothetical protein INT43_006647 [Umbelopsis isabellina]|uniref:BZIP domain-containing protein n=1 Tax=Mortierella isabellina TaxID=91625 RepID=A0A8H7ULX7_MORIS|nr:hypothetical protein INT43_006647 [Umbelopsis isabellina]